MISDAPWIREAERDGMPEYPAPVCPICGEETENYYIQDYEIVGCENCVTLKNAVDWNERRQ